MELSHAMASRQLGTPSTSGRQSWCIPRIPYASRPQGGLCPPFPSFSHSARRLTTHAVGGRPARGAPSFPAPAADDGWVEVGVVGPPHGVRGEFKVQPLTDFPEERLAEPGPRWLRAPVPKIGRLVAAEPEEVELQWGRSSVFKGRGVWIVKLDGIESPEEAALIRGHALLVPAAARAPLPDADEFYVQDLVGLRVVMDASGEEVGVVADIFDGTGTHDTLKIDLAPSWSGSRIEAEEEGEGSSDGEGEEGGPPAAPAAIRQAMLPFVKAMVPVVDVAGGVMRVNPPEGLFELATEKQEKKPRRREYAGKRERRTPRPGTGGDDGDAAPAPPPSDD